MLLIDSDPSRRDLLNAIGRLGDEAYLMLRQACLSLDVNVETVPPFRISAIWRDLGQLRAAAANDTSYKLMRKPRKPRKNEGPLMQEMTDANQL